MDSLCVKGRFGVVDFVHHEARIKTPLIRENGVLEEATWDEALEFVASRLKTFVPDEVGVVSSARSTNEANYVMQKFGRAVLEHQQHRPLRPSLTRSHCGRSGHHIR